MNPPNSSIGARTLRGLFWTSSDAGVRAVLMLGVTIVLARVVNPYEFGIIGAALVITELSEVVAHLGIGGALVQRQVLTRQHIATACSLTILLGSIITILVWYFAPSLALLFEMPALEPVLRTISLVFVIESIGAVARSLMARDLRFRELAVLEIAAVGIGYGATGITLALLGFGVWALVGAHLGKSLLRTALSVAKCPPALVPGFQVQACRELLHFGGGLTLTQISTYVAAQGDKFLVGRFLGAEALGLYGRAYQLTHGSAYLLGSPIERVFFPVLSKIQGESGQLASAYLRGTSLIALTVLPAAGVSIVLASEIVGLVLGARWDQVVLPLQVLLVGLHFRISDRLSESVLRATGHVYQSAWRRAVFLLILLCAAGWGLGYGLGGVAAGVITALVVQFVLITHLCLRIVEVSWSRYLVAQFRGVIAAALLAAAAFGVAELLRPHGLHDALLLALMAPALVVVLFFCRPVFRHPDLESIARSLSPRVAVWLFGGVRPSD